ncbi:MAG: hypothetical protein ACE5RJ_01590 [Nitrosopumilaceae archaeon]
MLELVGGIISIVVGVIMLIIGGSVINTVSTGGSIGDCSAQDYNGDGAVNATDQTTTAFIQCDNTRNNGYTILNIISVMMIIGGVVMSVRGFASG